MTALQVIIKEAQAIRRKSPKMEWKKAVAQASAIYANKHKGKSPVGKKHAKKKAVKRKVGAVKKAAKKVIKKVVRKKAVKKVVRKKAAKKVVRSLHKDTASHNVKISVMSGVGALSSHIIHELKEAHDKLVKWQKVLIALEHQKAIAHKGMKPVVAMDIKRVKEAIKEQKTHISQLKKHIK